jgi:hypothetical protein
VLPPSFRHTAAPGIPYTACAYPCQGMAAGARAGAGDGSVADTQPHYPRILAVESEVMVEPELIVVDVLLTLERPAGRYDSRAAVQNVAQHSAVAAADGAATSTGATGSEPAAAASTYRLALEVDGQHHFMRNRLAHQDGASAYRDRVLRRRLGPNGVVVVPTWIWVEQLRDEKERRRYLAGLLAATAAEAPPPPPQTGRVLKA